jgi:hypothetical protein
MNPWMRVLSAALFAAALSGCVALDYDTIGYDTPWPWPVEEDVPSRPVRFPGCNDPRRTPEQSCLALVHANQRHSRTGV